VVRNGRLRRGELGAVPLVAEDRYTTSSTPGCRIAIDEINRWIYFMALSTGTPAKYWIYRQSSTARQHARHVVGR
jgi:hypothetical protein